MYHVYMGKRKHVLIIGAGVVGCAAARQLSRYDIDITVVEKEGDVAEGTSKANSGIIHAGYAAKNGSLKAQLCVQGNALYDQLNSELNFGFRRCGSLVLGFKDEDLEVLNSLCENGKKNNVSDLKILDNKQILSIDPGINRDVKYGLFAPTAGVASPYEFAIALAENSISNGASFYFNSKVVSIIKLENGQYKVSAQKLFRNQTDGKDKVRSESDDNKYNSEVSVKIKDFTADYIVNAAGLFSDIISKYAGFNYFSITPRKGQYLIFDRFTGRELKSVLFQVPTKMGKGILVTPTYHNNLMIGPDALDIESREDTFTDAESLRQIIEKARLSYPGFDVKKIIRSFAGLRAVGTRGDFIVEVPEGGVNFINAAGIESPGLTSSPAIALKIESLLKESGLELIGKEDFNPYRKAVIKKREELPMSEVSKLTGLPSSPEKMICRCEQVREGVIRDSLQRGISVDSTDGVKRRTRAGMGICQGAYCRSRVSGIIAEEYNIPVENVVLPVREKEDLSFLKNM